MKARMHRLALNGALVLVAAYFAAIAGFAFLIIGTAAVVYGTPILAVCFGWQLARTCWNRIGKPFWDLMGEAPPTPYWMAPHFFC